MELSAIRQVEEKTVKIDVGVFFAAPSRPDFPAFSTSHINIGAAITAKSTEARIEYGNTAYSLQYVVKLKRPLHVRFARWLVPKMVKNGYKSDFAY